MKLWVSTRKGLFLYERSNAGVWAIKRRDFLGEPATLCCQDPRTGDTYVALSLGHFGIKMHRLDAGADSWNEIAVPKYPVAAEGEKGYTLKLVWSLSAGGPDQPGLLWAGTVPGGLFCSKDRGGSWELVTGLWDQPSRPNWFGGGYDEAGIHSILVDPRDSNRILIGISCAGVWETLDGGKTWVNHGKGLRSAYMPPEQADDPVSQDPHCMVRCPNAPDTIWMQHHNGIFLSDTAGQTWRELSEVQPSVFGFAVAVHPMLPGTAWFVPGIKDERRYPVDGQLVVNRTRDFGAHFEQLRSGLPQTDAYDLVYRHALTVCSKGTTLAFGSTTGNLWLSENQGDTWITLSHHLPPVSAVALVD